MPLEIVLRTVRCERDMIVWCASTALMWVLGVGCSSQLPAPTEHMPSRPDVSSDAGAQELYAPLLGTLAEPPIEPPDADPGPTMDAGAPADPHQNEAYRQPLPQSLVAAGDPANRYANLSPWQCRKELVRRKLPLKRQRETKGIATSLRFTAPMNGVTFITAGPKSPYSLLDCRLALTLDEVTKVWNNQGVISIRVDNFYRRAARLPGSRKRSQHAYGLAIDMTEIGLADGRIINVEEAWGAEIDVPPCGPAARVDDAVLGSLTLRNLVCELAAGGHFHHILTPAYDLAHKDHLHLDIKRGTKYGIIR